MHYPIWRRTPFTSVPTRMLCRASHEQDCEQEVMRGSWWRHQNNLLMIVQCMLSYLNRRCLEHRSKCLRLVCRISPEVVCGNYALSRRWLGTPALGINKTLGLTLSMSWLWELKYSWLSEAGFFPLKRGQLWENCCELKRENIKFLAQKNAQKAIIYVFTIITNWENVTFCSTIL